MGGQNGRVGVGRDPDSIHLGLLQPLRLGAAVLEPDLHLGLGQLELAGEFGSLGDGQILLLFVLIF